MCAAERPGFDYSYTHNWPYDPQAGNQVHGGVVLWSVISVLVVVLTIGVLFYYYGKLDREAVLEQQQAQLPPLATTTTVDTFSLSGFTAALKAAQARCKDPALAAQLDTIDSR